MRKLFAASVAAGIVWVGVAAAQQTPTPVGSQANTNLQVTPDGIATPNQEKARELADTNSSTKAFSFAPAFPSCIFPM